MSRLTLDRHSIQMSASRTRASFRRSHGAGFFTLLGFVFPVMVALTMSIASVSAATWMSRHALELVTVIHVPGAPASGWCFDLGAVGPGPTYVLANASQKELTLLNERTDTLMPPIGQGAFTGEAGCHQFDFARMGPEGVLVDDGQIFAGNGNSQVEVFNFWTHQYLFDLDTYGANRADEMAIGHGLLAVTNPDDSVPFLSFFSLRTHQMVKQLLFSGMNGVPKATAGLEQPQWFAGKFYLSVPATSAHADGEVDAIDPQTWHITSMPVPDCTPAGLAINAKGEAAVGCASGDQALLNVRTGQIIARVPVSYVDVVATLGGHFFFASYGSGPGQQPVQVPQLVVSDSTGHVLARRITTSQSHTVTVDPKNGHILVPEDGGNIFVFQET